MVALGEKIAGLYGSHPALVEDLQASSKRTNDKLWQMPLEESYRENIRSNIADIKNTGAKGGGSITAALFLQEFVESTPWAHIDMAGTLSVRLYCMVDCWIRSCMGYQEAHWLWCKTAGGLCA